MSDIKSNIEAVYPLSPMQQGMVFHSLYAAESGMYLEQLSCTLRGTLDAEAFGRAWQRVVDRHPVLRTSFAWKSLDRMLQVVQRQVKLPLESQNWQHLDRAEQQLRLQAFMESERRRGFDLSKVPLIRLALMQIADDSHFFVWSHHHALLDGWSLPLLLREVFTFYETFREGRDLYLEPPQPYRNYIAWLDRQDQSQAEDYWRSALKGFASPTPLAVGRSAEAVAAEPIHHAEHQIRLSTQTTAALQSQARRYQLTLNTMVQGAWALLLHRYSGDHDIVFGATVAGRPADLPGVESMIGLFINTLPVRALINPDQPVGPWLQNLQQQTFAGRQFEYASLVDVQAYSDVPRGTPLFESLLVFENYPMDQSLSRHTGSLRIEDIQSAEATNYPITLVTGPSEALPLKISYDARRFDQNTIGRMLGHLCVLLEAMAANLDQPVQSLPLLTGDERQLLLEAWNDTSRNWQEAELVHRVIEAQAATTPDALAVLFADDVDVDITALSYDQLNRQANQLARYLARQGVAPGILVGIYLERSAMLPVALLAVLKAGGAYLPLDPTYPQERLAFMIQDASIQVLISQEGLIEGDGRANTSWMPGPVADDGGLQSDASIILLDRDWPMVIAESDQQLDTELSAADPAYVIYTSGSTGLPKGVVLPHSALCNHALAFARMAQLAPNDRVLQFISLSFDAAAEEIFPTLVAGAAMVIPGAARDDVGLRLARFCQHHAVTVLHMPATVWNVLLDDLADHVDSFPSALRLLTTGGEPPDMQRLRAFTRLLGHPIDFLNLYGPTETAITSTIYRTTTAVESYSGVAIGQPIDNATVYVLDAQQRPVPVGVPGELYVGGRGVAQSYLNRPGLTAQRFVPNPFLNAEPTQSRSEAERRMQNAEAGKQDRSTTDEIRSIRSQNPLLRSQNPLLPLRLYRTGDLVRWLDDGNLEFLGRVDDQIKIRGLRVEPGEIEAIMKQHPGVLLAAVAAREDASGQKRLIGYLVSGQGSAPSPQQLREFLSQRLPDYMVPGTYVSLEDLPRTPSGKVNRRALPRSEDGHSVVAETYVPARSPLEEVLAELWAKVLGLQRVGVHDNFFDLGGHSLLATQLASRIRDVFQIQVPLQVLFEAPTIAGLSRHVEAALRSPKPEDQTEAGQLEAGEDLQPMSAMPRGDRWAPTLSFAQQRLWFLDQLEPGNLFYNIPMAVHIAGALDVDALARSLNEIVRRHEVLRTTFHSQDGKPVASVVPELHIPLPVEDLSRLAPDERMPAAESRMRELVRQPFHLGTGPLLQARLLQLDDQEHVALVVMHHIVSDGWSLAVLTRELGILYQAFAGGRPSPLPALPLQYSDFAAWQRTWLAGQVRAQQLAYWKHQLGNSQSMLDLPIDRPRPAVQSSRGATLNFNLPGSLLNGLSKLSRKEGTTLYMTLLAAFQTLLYRYTGQADISVGTPIANRNRGEIEGLIGFFVNTLVMRGDLSGNPSFRELLQRVRQVALEAYMHQDLPFEMLVEALQPQRDLSHTPLFQVAFGLQNTPLQAIELPGITLTPLPMDSGTAKFDLTLVMAEHDQGLAGSFEYNADLFDPGTMERMRDHLHTLLAAIVEDPDLPIAKLPILTERQQQQLLVHWNLTALHTPLDRCAHELIEARAAAQPDVLAALFQDRSLTYGELNRRANQLAHFLRKQGVGPDAIVGLSTERSLEMVIGILGILKAGGAYLPIDPTYPRDRIAFMIQDSGIQVLLTSEWANGRISEWANERISEAANRQISKSTKQQSGKAAKQQGSEDSFAHAHIRTFADSHIRTVLLDSHWPTIAQEPDTNPPLNVTPDNLAYVIYTSGSTGRPKGAMLAHRGLSNLAEVQRQAYDIHTGSRILQFSPLSFDASVWETIMALGNGGTLCLAPQEVLTSGPELLRLLRQQRVTHVTLPPSMLMVLESESLPDLEVVVAAGEKCTREIVARWAPGRRFFDAYGPTETTVCASMAPCDPESPQDPSIGRPIANCQLYIVDRYLQPVPIGVPGELVVAGANVGRGYLNRPALTAERFVPNPFLNPERVQSRSCNAPRKAQPGVGEAERRSQKSEFRSQQSEVRKQDGSSAAEIRAIRSQNPLHRSQNSLHRSQNPLHLYRTGDLVRYLPDGNIQFLGRIDHQVKVRGFRIELGEIESVLREAPDVLDAVVTAEEDVTGTSRLVGYVLTDSADRVQASSLRVHLRQHLPEHMVPSVLLLLDSFPLTPSGKVDRQALAAMEDVRPAVETAYVPPRDETEEKLAAICSQLLAVDQVGIHDNFFDLGGHSLLATQFISRVREAFGVELPLRTLFEHPTIAGLAQELAATEATPKAEAAKVADVVQSIKDLSPEQVQALLASKRAGGDGPAGEGK